MLASGGRHGRGAGGGESDGEEGHGQRGGKGRECMREEKGRDMVGNGRRLRVDTGNCMEE